MSEIDWDKAEKIFKKDKENILDSLEKNLDRYPYSKEILTLLAAGVVISAVLFMPGIGKVFSSSVWSGEGYNKRRLKQVLKRFENKKIVEVVETTDGAVVRITKNGFTKALKYKLEEIRIKRQKKWDKKWRIVIFDIPERKKRIREELRARLRQMEFHRLQESVYVHAFPSFNEVEFLRQVFGVDISVTYIIAQKIEGQDNLKKIFNVI